MGIKLQAARVVLVSKVRLPLGGWDMVGTDENEMSSACGTRKKSSLSVTKVCVEDKTFVGTNSFEFFLASCNFQSLNGDGKALFTTGGFFATLPIEVGVLLHYGFSSSLLSKQTS